MSPSTPMQQAHPHVSPISGKPCGKGGCTGRKKRAPTELCDGPAIVGTDRCRMHVGKDASRAQAEGAVVAAVRSWGLGDSTVDPGEVLLRLVTQSAVRAEMYAELLRDAYEAAERLKAAHEAQDLLLTEASVDEDGERAAVQQARLDLDRIFNIGGVSALIGQTYSDTRAGDLYATGEALRGLAKLEADERDRCASFAAKAVAAGLAERQVRLAERQASMVSEALSAVLAELGLSSEQQQEARRGVARHLRLVAS